MRDRLPQVNLAGTGYVDAIPVLRSRTFRRAMSFHLPETLAAVADESGAYHITVEGTPAYAQRFIEAFGYYDGVATVRDEQGYFHIDAKGHSIHSRRYQWAGNFQEGLCPVQDATGFFHVALDGTPAYEGRHAYAGDFKYGVAVVHTSAGMVHIRPDGTRVHERAFLSAQPFHKGYAVVEDESGFHHVDERGAPLYPHRFRVAEPFYNGVALCTDLTGRRVRLHENGYYRHLPTVNPMASAADILRMLGRGCRVGLLVRHAERHAIRDGWGNDAMLTEEGLAQAHRLGRRLSGPHALTTLSSPVGRCIQTAVAFADGASQSQELVCTKLLGDPGPFHDLGDGAGPKVGPEEFGDFATRYVLEGRAPGMLPLEVACTGLLAELHERMRNGLTLFVSHDLFIAGLAAFLGLKQPSRHDWADFLEGVCVCREADGSTSWHRFSGLEELIAC